MLVFAHRSRPRVPAAISPRRLAGPGGKGYDDWDRRSHCAKSHPPAGPSSPSQPLACWRPASRARRALTPTPTRGAWRGFPRGHPDCDDGDAAVNPAASEDLATPGDDDCDGHAALGRRLIFDTFPAPPWSKLGAVATPLGSVTLGNGVDKGGRISRTFNVLVPTGAIHLAADVESYSGPAGSACTATVTTAPQGGGASTSATWDISASGTQASAALAATAPSRVLNGIAIECEPGERATLDWLTVQNSTSTMAPIRDLAIAWEDVDAPGGGLTTTVVRSGSAGVLLAGSDVGGVAIKDGTTEWRTINGTAPGALMAQPYAGVTDLLSASWGELFVLTGRDSSSAGRAGGLLYSDDEGSSWTVIAESVNDDVAGDAKFAACGGIDHGGGHLLAEGGVETVYIANGDEDDYGVDLWDGLSLCDLPDTGSGLPAEPIGALAAGRSYTSGLPWLMVGYRGRGGSNDGLYVCELPADTTDADADADTGEDGLTCSVGSTACVPLGDTLGLSLGWDVRDIELYPLEDGVVFVADAANDPEAATCDDANGAIYKVIVDDDGTDLEVSVSNDFASVAFDYSAGSDDVDITGLAIDPAGAYLVAFTPVSQDKGYFYSHGFRIDAALVSDPVDVTDVDSVVASDWQAITGTTSAERAQREGMSDLGGAWLEATTPAEPAPYPGYHMPGNGYDGVFYDPVTPPAYGTYPLVVATEFELWEVEGMDDPAAGWDADTDTSWEFWPEITTTHDQAWQTSVVNDIAADSSGNIWMPASDIGLFMLPDGGAAAQVDCFWDYYNAGGLRVSVGSDDSVWVLLYDQGSNEIPHEIGVFRTTDEAVTWTYEGAGVQLPAWRSSTNQAWCKDQDTGHVAEPMSSPSAFGLTDGAAFNEGSTSTLAESWGNPAALDVLDASVALVGFGSYSYGSGASEVTGTVGYTIDGGESWHQVDFDGDWDGDAIAGDADDCDEHDFYAKLKGMVLVGKGDTSAAWELDSVEGLTDASEGGLDFFLASRDSTAGGASDGQCALARVQVDSTGATWTWYDLSDTTLDCAVDEENMRGIVASPWSDDLFIWGSYDYVSTGSSGGVCAMDIDDVSLTRQVVDPDIAQFSIGDVAPHPQVSDLIAVAPILDADAWVECMSSGAGDCPDEPRPILMERTPS
ncbi:MAG: hypothetical protein FJ102_02050, partial [Deltaproteobacteria bacterium]|nr:hypothetical protein [Deltaproteobacteria bacterium]